MNAQPPLDAGNPFSSRCVRPGAIPFLFPDALDAEILLGRFHAAAQRGEIVGPHGSGKSTLLATLAHALRQAGRNAVLVELHDGQRRLPADLPSAVARDGVVLVDGYEQLGLWSRWRLKRICRWRGLGLIVTSHRPTGLPSLYRTSVNGALACRVVNHLLDQNHPAIAQADVIRSLERNRGDLREVLFDLYDLYESRNPPCTEK